MAEAKWQNSINPWNNKLKYYRLYAWFPNKIPNKKGNVLNWGALFHPLGRHWVSLTLHPTSTVLCHQYLFPHHSLPTVVQKDSGKKRFLYVLWGFYDPPNCCKASIPTIWALSKIRMKSYLSPHFRRKWRISILQKNKYNILLKKKKMCLDLRNWTKLRTKSRPSPLPAPATSNVLNQAQIHS